MNHTDTDFEDEVRQMLDGRAADIRDRPRREVLPITAVGPEMPTPESRRRVHFLVGAAAVLVALTAGLVMLRVGERREISTVPADSPAQPTVWPNEATSADRTSAARAARSFSVEVIGRPPTTVTPDPEAAPDGPIWVDLELDTANVRLLAAPTADGWVILQLGDGGPPVSADPPTAHATPVAGASDIEVRIDATGGVAAVHVQADQLVDGVALSSELDEIRSIVAIYRDPGGAVLAVHGGHYG